MKKNDTTYTGASVGRGVGYWVGAFVIGCLDGEEDLFHRVIFMLEWSSEAT